MRGKNPHSGNHSLLPFADRWLLCEFRKECKRETKAIFLSAILAETRELKTMFPQWAWGRESVSCECSIALVAWGKEKASQDPVPNSASITHPTYSFIEFLLFLPIVLHRRGFHPGISWLFFAFPTSSGEVGCESGTVAQLARGKGGTLPKGCLLHCAQAEEPCTVAWTLEKMARHTCLPASM